MIKLSVGMCIFINFKLEKKNRCTMYYKCENQQQQNVNNIDLKLRNKWRRQMHYNIGATKSVFNGHTVVYFVVPVITRTSNPPISQFSRPCNEFMRVWWMFPYNRSKIASYHVIKDQHLNSVLYKKPATESFNWYVGTERDLCHGLLIYTHFIENQWRLPAKPVITKCFNGFCGLDI